MSNLSQMLGLAVHNFTSAAVGMAVLAAFIRGLARRRASTLGNFWVDLTRTMTRILVPVAFVFALVLVSQGVIQNFHGNRTVKTVEGTEQVIPGGPAASQISIKQLGTNGGGFFNVNSAHPFENSGPFNNFLEMYAIVALPFGFAFMFGRMVERQAPGASGLRHHARDLGRHVVRGDDVRRERQSEAHGAGREPIGHVHAVRREHGGQGGSLRPRGIGLVGGVDDRNLERVRQLDARQLHAARRHGDALAHDARRGQPRRRGCRV